MRDVFPTPVFMMAKPSARPMRLGHNPAAHRYTMLHTNHHSSFKGCCKLTDFLSCKVLHHLTCVLGGFRELKHFFFTVLFFSPLQGSFLDRVKRLKQAVYFTGRCKSGTRHWGYYFHFIDSVCAFVSKVSI